MTGLYVESVLIEQSEPHKFLAGPFYLPVDVEALAALDVAGNEREEVLIWDGATLYFFDLEQVEAGPQPLAPQPPAPISAVVGVNYVGSERRDLVIADGDSLYVLDLDEAIGWMGPVEQPVNITGLTALDVGGSTPREELIASDGTGLQVLDLDANVPSWQPVDPPPPTSPEVVTTTGIAVVSDDEIVEAFTLLTVINGQNAYVLVEEDGEQFWAGPLYRRFLTLVHSPIDLELQAQTRGAVLTIAAPTEAALSFTDVAADSGLGSYTNPGGDGHCPGAVFAEIDNDDLPDLYLVKGFSSDPSTENIMFRNQGNGTFTGVPSAAGANDPRNSVGAVLGDYDQRRRRGRGNMDLYRNRLELGAFALQLPEPNPVPSPRFSWGTSWVDFDNDGDLDLHVATNSGVMDWLHLNDGTHFTDVALAAGAGQAWNSRASIVADFDADGWMDLLVVNRGNIPPLLLANRTAEQIPGAWLKVNLVGDPTLAGVFKSSRDAVGARIEATVGGVTQQRDIRAGGHTCGSTRSYVAHFGLGSAGGAEQVSVFWPSGRVTTLRDVGAGQTISLVETAPCLADCNGDGNVRVDELVTTTGIALGSTSLVNCLAADRNGDGTLTIDEVVGGVDTALNGCA